MSDKKVMTREEVISVIRQTVEESGRTPRMTELVKAKRVSEYDVRKHFGIYASALHACGLEPEGSGHEATMKQLFTDWVEVTRRVGRVPTVGDYQLHSRYSLKPLMRQFGAWPRVPAGMAQYARQNGLEEDGDEGFPGKVERTFQGTSVISEGLSGGEDVVVDGQLLLSDGTRVESRARKAGA